VFKDFDKSVQDIFNDDFDLKNTLKVKTIAPYGVSVTTASEIVCGCCSGGKSSSSIGGKITTKWAHESGFAIDKFEMKSNGALNIETSLSGVHPGLKIEFKGDDCSKADLGATYKTEHASVTAEVDVAEFQCAKASVLGGNGQFAAGASTGVCLGEKFAVKDFDVAASYKINQIFAGLKVSDKFSKYGLSLSYVASPVYSLAALASFNPEKGTHSGHVGATYRCNPNTLIKGKVSSDLTVAASVKQTLEKNATVVGAVEFPLQDVSCFKYGITLTLG
jgi:hypothetical protein